MREGKPLPERVVFLLLMENNEGAYFIIIPGVVRNEKKISAESKLLFGEIMIKCNTKGYCWATNAYFAKVFDCAVRSIQRYLGELESVGFVTIEIEKSDEGTERKLFVNPRAIVGVSSPGMSFQSYPSDSGVVSGHDGSDIRINKSIYNKKDNNEGHVAAQVLAREGVLCDSVVKGIAEMPDPEPAKKEKKKKFTPPAQSEIHEVFISKGKMRQWPEDYCRLEADKFMLHYQANGWVQGRGKPIVDWKAAAAQWIGRNNEFKAPTYQPRPEERPAPPQVIASADPAKDLQYMYDRFLEGKLKPAFIDITCYDYAKNNGLLRGVDSNAILLLSCRERIKQLTGSNQSSDLKLLEAYSNSNELERWPMEDRPCFMRIFKKMALLIWFRNAQAENKKQLL